ncbi:MAG TPA: mannose-6-phosphate isomerase [Bacteroidales bacterium]|jgi:mannose-6-phosphate isomerase|nr:mannose-6-phosphate isomerase [Bacteroidales bacterium]HBZ21577.1 mannose-6-phosphate isomerase [Bacteroidales bacterium]
MSELYPLKFEPILKEKIWGGSSLADFYGKRPGNLKNIGESWELSAVSDNLSVISNGFLAGNNIEEIIEVYMGDITGDSVFEKFGNEFPLLIKLIEARHDLSVQVHPDDELAKERHQAYGKTEMWHILRSENNAKIFTGFSRPVSRNTYIEAVKNNSIGDLLNTESAAPGDTFFTPAGRIHAIGAGIVLAEIQQTSDITYRIYDWGRKDKNGKSRQLHTDLALDAIDFNQYGRSKIIKEHHKNRSENLVSCKYFDTNIIQINEQIARDYNLIDSFVVYICTEGRFVISWDSGSESVTKGETVLLPAMISDVVLVPEQEATLLETYISNIGLR